MPTNIPNKTITRREALVLGIPGAALLATGASLLPDSATAQQAQPSVPT